MAAQRARVSGTEMLNLGTMLAFLGTPLPFGATATATNIRLSQRKSHLDASEVQANHPREPALDLTANPLTRSSV